MSDSMEMKLPNAEQLARDWAAFMDVTAPFEVQVGSFDRLTEEAHIAIADASTGHEWGVTIGAPDNSRFIIGINEKCPPDKLEQVIVHELVHVHTFSQCGNDEREAMEVATELAAGLVRQLRMRERPCKLHQTCAARVDRHAEHECPECGKLCPGSGASLHPEAVPANNRDATTPPILGGDHEEEPSSIPAQRTSLGAEAGTSTDPLPPKALEAASNAIRDELRECDSDEWTPEYLAECGLRAALPHMTIQAKTPEIDDAMAIRFLDRFWGLMDYTPSPKEIADTRAALEAALNG